MGLGIWGNRAGKAVILLAVAGVVGATGYLAGHGAAAPRPVVESLPEPDFAPRVITVKNGSITSRLVLDATIAAEPAVPVLPEKDGTVTKVFAKAGQYVGRGEAVVQFTYTPEAVVPADPKKKPKTPKPQTLYLRATATGKVTDLNAHVGSSVSAGEAAFSVDVGRFRAVATVESKNVYKLYNEPESIKLKIDHGPAPFRCALIDYGAGVGGKADDENGKKGMDGGESGTEVQVTCRIPRAKRVFAGLPAKMSILTDRSSRVPVVPLSAVLGQSGTGFVTVVDGGKQERRRVELGLNDGSMVEIRDGLEVGEKILDRAPEDTAFAGPGDAVPDDRSKNGPVIMGPGQP
ncbi:hypothetical protein [Actinocorallia longicatena]|uniref:HlyD family efflux transporter periplasmic adaptor subunit n=1 Tax=Actinocorallia longicatena TaxID=111803 RepID=A0ABP6QCJ7_9ACTN